ncbi:hypothetical protein C2869_01955 [Saccharobesus litoralis]|uniref:N-acetyltransferase domain-containing protein n=1 Tax=Saccharobesus litoralis TaxID=2172099 RepID=A0A2S0VM45_9ALTE|nr:GNAT family N-acetyltransferase [Saccharobesus litoralis]AWB65284.1 hypothetical protein C2869_01955 [Saccharobesus litoralis]
MKFRHSTDSDYQAIVALYNRCKLDEFVFEPQPLTLLPLEQDNKRAPIIFSSDILLAEDERVNGFCAYKDSTVIALYVDKPFRSKGLGAKLLRQVLTKMPLPISLYVVATNVQAIAFYTKLGFITDSSSVFDYNGVDVVANKMLLSQFE